MGKTNRLKGFAGLLLLLMIGLFPLYPIVLQAADDSVCAEVKIEIKQELTLERQAFDAHMRINNGLSHITLEEIAVDVSFADEEGNSILASSDPDNGDAVFYIRVDSMENIDNIEGFGTIAPSSSADIHWLIIPAPGASNGLDQGTLYYVGATFTYTIGGEENVTEVTPDYIFVKPMPELTLDYFLPSEVYGDDAWTIEIEPPVLFSLGVRLRNNGSGVARNLKIDSAQPKITDNGQGLLIGFNIEGSEINGQPATNSLLADIGDIGPGESGLARWTMACTLSGQFVEFDAGFSHSDELGGELTSLIEDVNTHFLVRDVLVDLPGRDSIRDFLARDDDIYRVYESDSEDTDITDQSASSTMQLEGQYGSEIHYTLSTPATSGFMYIQLPDPYDGQKVLAEAVRSDGKLIKEDNAWLSKTRKENPEDGWYYFVNLFDADTTDSYTLVFEDASAAPQPPALQFISDRSGVEEALLSFIVEASDPDGTTPVLSAAPIPAGADFTDEENGTGVFTWTPSVGQAGTYEITFRASDGVLEDFRRVVITINSIDDTDGDGLPDVWEMEHFGTLDRDGTGDFDGDGISDLDEYLLGTDPGTTDTPPSIPEIFSPENGSEVTVVSPNLVVNNSTDPNGDALTYEFELYADKQMADLVASDFNVSEMPGTTSWTVIETLNDNAWYYWRVRATDGVGYSIWAYGSFFVNTDNDPPGDFNISSPRDDTQIGSLMPVLQVTNTADIDEDMVTYTFEVYADSGLSALVASGSDIPEGTDGATSWVVDQELDDSTWYFWRAVAMDEHGALTATTTASFLVNTANNAPGTPIISSPSDNSEVTVLDLDLVVSNAGDGDGDALGYFFELDRVDTFDSETWQTSGEIIEGVDTTAWHVTGLEDNTLYYWRVKVSDGASESGWDQGSFFVNTANDAPLTPTLKNPGEKSWVETLTPVLAVNHSIDPDNDSLIYRFEVYSNESLSDPVVQSESSAPEWTVSPELEDNTRYFWRARAEDEHGLASDWMDISFFFVRSTGVNEPPQIAILEPVEDILTNADNILVSWDDSDPDSNAEISLYYDMDDSGEDGTMIVQGLEEDPEGPDDSYTWDITGLEGAYYIYAVITDGVSSATFYAPGAVIIDRTPPTVEASPPGGTYDSAQSVILYADETALIYYTTDGTDPTIDSPLYDSSLDLVEDTTLKFMAVDSAGNQSEIITRIYTIQEPEYLSVIVENKDGAPFSGLKVYAFTESGSYTGKNATTDENGTVFFDPEDFEEGTYEFRVDYLGRQFWSDPVAIPGSFTVEVIVEEETVAVTVTTAAGSAEGVRVYLFSEGGSYLGVYGETDENGAVSFDLPVGSNFMFRADILGNQYWSDMTTIYGGETNNVPVDTGGGLFQISVQEDLQSPMQGINVYLFGESGSYLGLYDVTDPSGVVVFSVPEGSFKIRADYLGYQFWSDATPVSEDTDIDLAIPHQEITITANGFFQETPEPIEGITVYLFTPSGSYLSQNQVTDAYGEVVFHLPDQPYKVRADYLGQPFWSEEFTGVDTPVNIPMADAEITVTGSGWPLEGVNLYLFSVSDSYLGILETTDADGKVIFHIPAGDYKFRADYQGSQYWSDAETLVADQLNPIEISTGGGTFSFTVLQEENEPLAGVSCYVFSEQGSYLGMSGTTSSEGIVSFNLADGNYTFRVDHLGYQFWSEVYSVPDTLSDVFTIFHQDVTLTVNSLFQGTPEPIEGIDVYLFAPSGSYLGQYRTTDEYGRGVFNLPEMAYKVRADYLGRQFWSEEFTGVDTLVDIPMADAEITVTDGVPLEGVTVYVFSVSGSYLSVSGATGVDGKITFRLPAGDYKFRADYQGSQFWSEEETLIADQVSPVDISTGGGPFNLTVLKDATDPLVGGNCYVFNEAGSYLGISGITSSEGLVSFELADGNYKFRVDHLGYQFWSEVYSVPDTLSDVFTIFHQDVTLTVSSLFQGTPEPLEGITVYLFTPSGSYLSCYQTTDDIGQATFNLPDQPYKVRVDYLGRQFWSEEFTGVDTPVNIPTADAEITVTDGVPLEGVTVYVFSVSGSYLSVSGATGVDGKIAFRLPAGDYKFRADYQGSQFWSEEETLIADQVNPVDISTGGGSFTLTVLEGITDPLVGGNCYVFNEAGSYLGMSGTSNSEGQVTFELADGNYKFRVDHLGYQFWSEVYSVPNTLSDDLIIWHQDITVTVEGLSYPAEPLEGLNVYLFTPSGSYLSRYQVTNASGQVVFNLPDQPYKVRVDYLGQQFWSEVFQSQNTTVTINRGFADIHVHRSGVDVENACVYLFSEGGSYLGWYQNTNASGKAGFLLPDRLFQFRIDEGGDQVWSPVTDIIAGEVNSVEVDLD